MDMQTNYLGLTLKNPLVPSASPLSRSVDLARRLEDAGAAALIMYSLFEEELHHEQTRMLELLDQDIGHSEADSFLPLHQGMTSALDGYLEQIHRLKKTLEIPVIASLNGVSMDGWVEIGQALQQAGADALELNVYYIPTHLDETGQMVEDRYVELLRELRGAVSLPIAMKLTPQFSAIGNMVRRLEEVGLNGVSLFNRLYQPDIDVDSLRVASTIHLSQPVESLMVLRWIALLHGHVNVSLGATGGVHRADDAIKMLLAGADVVHLCSVLLKEGPQALARILDGMREWLEHSAFDSIDQVRGMLSMRQSRDAQDFVRSSYVSMLSSYPIGNL